MLLFRVLWSFGIVCWFYAPLLSSSNYFVNFQEIGSKYGLESTIIRRIHQDKAGFIWISTINGLARFDGYSFKYYRTKELIGKINSVLDVIGECDDMMWIYKREPLFNTREVHNLVHIFLFNTRTEEFLSFRNGIGLYAPFEENSITALREIDGRIYVGLARGDIYSYKSGKWKLELVSGVKEPILAMAGKGANEPLWAVRGDTLLHISPGRAIVEKDWAQFDWLNSWGLRLDPWNRLWVVLGKKNGKSSIYIKQSGQPFQTIENKFRLDVSSYSDVYFDNSFRMWLFKDNSFHVFVEGGKEILQLPGTSSLSELPIFFADRAGQAWIGFRTRFVAVQIQKKNITNYFEQESASFRGMVELPDKSILVSSNRGIYKLSSDRRSSSLVIKNPDGFSMISASGKIWVGLHGPEILAINPMTLEFEKWRLRDTNILRPKRIHLLVPYMDRRGNLWVGTNYGLMKGDYNTKRIIRSPLFDKGAISEVEIAHFFENDEGIWLSTQTGILNFNPEKGTWRKVVEFPFENISYIYEKPKGVFWVGVRLVGLVKWNRNTGEKEIFNSEKGFPNNNIHAILEDSLHHFWIPSDNGLIRFNPSNNSFQVFFTSNGLSNSELNRQSFLRTSDGRLLFGTIDGLNELDPLAFREVANVLPTIQVTQYDEWDLQTGRMANRTPYFFDTGRIVLPYYNRSFQIRFSLLDFSKLSVNQYQYRVDGIDSDWITIQENYLRFTGLPYGNYTLRIRGITPEGGKSANELAIPIEVQKPFYRRQGIILFFGLVVLGMVALFIQLRTQSLDASKKELEREVADRTLELEKDKQTIALQNKELASLNQTKDHLLAVVGHELRGPMLSIQNIGDNISYLLENGKFTQAAQLGKQVKQRVFSVRMLLDNLLYWGLQQSGRKDTVLELVSVPDLIVETIELVEFWIASKQQEVKIYHPDNLTAFTDRHMLRIILLNLLTNAIKFTPKEGSIQISAGLTPSGNQVFVDVQDTGLGMDMAQIAAITEGTLVSTSGTDGEKGTGMGLSLCHKLLGLIGGQLQISAVPGEGSRFIVYLPLDSSQISH